MKQWMQLGLAFCLALAAASAAAESVVPMPDAGDFETLPELSPAQLARMQALVGTYQDDWTEVDALRSARNVSMFEQDGSELLIAPDGRYALLRFEHDWDSGVTDRSQPLYATLGRVLQRGEWLELWEEGHANPAPELPAEADAATAMAMAVSFALTALPEGSSIDQAIDFLTEQMRLYATEVATLPVSEAAQETAEPEQRFLRLGFDEGELLVEESNVAVLAQSWSGQGPLWLNRGLFWSKGLEPAHAPVAGLYGSGFLLVDPLAAPVPAALKRMLRVDAIDARIVETADDPAARVWSWGSTRALYRIDKGERDGLYKGMQLRPVQETGEVLTVDSVERDSAIVMLRLERFSPKDTVSEPQVGDVYVSRKDSGQRQVCGIDTSAAVRAGITAVRMLDEGKADAEGFVWLEVDIDHGSRHGLELEQALSLEGGSYASGESRLRRLDASSATLLWRVHTAFGDTDVPLPVVGGHALTRAWQRASEELFGF